MTIQEIQQEILRMKKEQDVCILAHAYQGQEILEVADYMGDSYGLLSLIHFSEPTRLGMKSYAVFC